MPFTEEWAGGAFKLLAERIAPRLVGRDAGEFSAILDELARSVAGNPCARGAVDMALYDLAGKAAGVPVHVLLGGKLRDRIPVLWPLGSESLEESLEVVSDKVSAGYRTFMIKTGSRDVAEDARRTLALIERYPDVAFQADANQGWSEAEALRFVHLVGAAPLALLEQPVPRNNPEGLARVHAAALFPVSADEGVFSLTEAARLARMGAVDVFHQAVEERRPCPVAQDRRAGRGSWAVDPHQLDDRVRHHPGRGACISGQRCPILMLTAMPTCPPCASIGRPDRFCHAW